MKKIFGYINNQYNYKKTYWRYIFATCNKYVVLVFYLFSLLSMILPTDQILNGISSLLWKILVAIFLLVFVYVAVLIVVVVCNREKNRICLFELHSKHFLYVEYGDLFKSGEKNERKNIAFAGNRCFDTIVDDDLIGSKKVHGMALKRLYGKPDRDEESVSKEIQDNLSMHKYQYTEVKKEDKRKGNLKRYELGAVAEIDGLENERYFILGLTTFNKELRARPVETDEYIQAMSSLLKYISNRSQEYPTYMPVIGAGGSDVGDVNELLEYMIKTIKMFKDIIDCDIHIVVYDKKEIQGLKCLKTI